jgi:membrane protein
VLDDPAEVTSAGSDEPRSRAHPRQLASGLRTRGGAAVDRQRDWLARQDASTRPGVAIGWWSRYRAIDGPLQSLLLTAYVFLAILPAMLVLAEYVDRDPASLANHMVHRYGLTGSAARQLREILISDRTHELGSALFAIVAALFFGLGFGRVIQQIYARAWRIEVQERFSDQGRYAGALLVLFGMIALLEIQSKELAGHGFWAGAALAPVWVLVLTLFYVWAPWMLTHKQLSARALVPGAALTALGLVALMYISTVAMPTWVDLYASDYAGLGVVMALFFWFGLNSTVIVIAASLSPVLAERRQLHGLGPAVEDE